MCKFELWETSEAEVADILSMSAFKIDELAYRNIVFKDSQYSIFNQLLHDYNAWKIVIFSLPNYHYYS